MNTSILLLILALIGIGSYLLGSRRAVALSGGRPSSMHSRAGYHGSYAVVWAVLPAAFILCAWLIVSPLLVTSAVRGSFPEDVRAQSEAQQSLTYGMVTSIARGLQRLTPEETAQVEADTAAVRPLLASKGVAIAGDPERFMVDAAHTLNSMTSTSRIAMIAVVLLAALGGGAYALRAIAPRFRARNQVEKVILAALLVASSIAILTTIGIVLSMLTEAIQFFTMVPAHQFFFGTVWDPRFAAAGATDSSGQFGLIPLLAGIPTIVYGFFALTTVGPFLRDISTQINGLATGNYANFIQAQSVITAGFVMGIMLIPYVSSLSDDIITAVPRSLRDGSLGLGATRSETIKRVIIPAALPGIVGAVLMTASRAIGETMIVVLAAGVAARLQLNPFEPMTTVTVKIVSQLTGDLEFTSPQTLVAFALGITLFAITLCLNIYALYIVRKYREQYE